MQKNTVCFVSYLDQDNLGVGYIASTLLQKEDYSVLLVDIREPVSVIVENIIASAPLIVGFSIVFQAHLSTFRELMATLRQHGVHSHFTAGGHYPSLRYEKLMQLVPELDSVVLFEGEYTLVELAEALSNNSQWQHIQGIAFKNNGAITRNNLRPLENDLDRFPLPVRRPVRPMILGRKVVNLIAGRGCYYQCSFCSIRQFYSHPPGEIKRVRRPEFVAQEMLLHHEQENCSVFIFQDDDFPVHTNKGHDWIGNFCQQLRDKKLDKRVMWKISCRANEVDESLLKKMKDHGLGMVYLGIESGTSGELESMNKQITPEQSLETVRVLKKLDIPFEFGFMMFTPDTTFDSLRKNVTFLKQLCGDGSATVGLSKMLPLAGTKVEETLRLQNRLHGKEPCEDYQFLDPDLNKCFIVLSRLFHSWMHEEFGFMNYSRWVHLQIQTFHSFCDQRDESSRISDTFHNIVSSANQYLLNTLMSVMDIMQEADYADDDLSIIRDRTIEKHNRFCMQLKELRKHVDNVAGVVS